MESFNFDVVTDVNTLRESISDKDAVLNILCDRNKEQCEGIKIEFNRTGHQSLEDEIKSRFNNNFGKIMLALIMEPSEFYADQLHAALLDFEHNIISRILIPQSNSSINDIKSCYKARHTVNLEDQIKTKLSDQFKYLLLDVCKSERDESDVTDSGAAVDDARKLLEEKDPYSDEYITVFLEIFSKRNFKQLKLIVEEFRKIAGKPIEDHLESLFKREDVLGYKAIVEYAEDKYFFYARCLNDALSSNNSTLIGLVLLQCDDLEKVKKSFELNFGDSLRTCIHDKTKKQYKYALYKLFGFSRSG